MNEKHYDNLCEMAQNTSEPGARLYAEFASIHFANADKYSQANRSGFIRSIAILYNMLDILCIALDCEDEVQDIAEQLAAEKVLPRA